VARSAFPIRGRASSSACCRRSTGLGFAIVVALTLFVILDIEYPRLGFVRLDAIDQLLVNVRAGMN
jgi:hypothetical protein